MEQSAGADGRSARRRRWMRARVPGRRPILVPLLYAVGAVLAAWVLSTLDGSVDGQSLPDSLRFGPQNARTLLGALVGGLLTIVALVFWVRMLAVQVTSEEFSPRLLRPFLLDRIQQHTMGAVIGGLAYCMVVLRALPDGVEGMNQVPHISVWGAVVTAVVAALVVVAAVNSGFRNSQLGQVVRSLANATVAAIRTRHPERGEEGSGGGGLERNPPEAPDGPCTTIRSHDSGWVQRVDEGRLLAAISPGSVIELDLRAGVFVLEGTPLARVWDHDETDEGAVRQAFQFGADPTMEEDISLGIRQLGDIAERALSPDVGDSTTVYEVIAHIGLVLRELLLRDLPVPVRTDEEERTLLRPNELSIRELVNTALSRIRLAGPGAPGVYASVLDTVALLVEELDEHGLGERADYLRYQASLTVEHLDRQDLLEADKGDIRRRAQRLVSIEGTG